MSLSVSAPDPVDAPASPPAANPAPLEVAKALAGLSRRDRSILDELTLLADRHGQASPSQAELAHATRLSVRTVRDALKALEAGGWLTREPVNLGKVGRANDRYTVNPSPKSAPAALAAT